MLAIRGHEFTLIQDLLYGFYQCLSDVKEMKAGQKTEMESHWPDLTKESMPGLHAYLEKSLKSGAEALCLVFLDAIEARDEKKFLEFAKAIKFLKKFEKKGDNTRAKILALKIMLEKDGTKWTLAQLAKALNRPQDEAFNGYATLRKIAEKLNFPLRLNAVKPRRSL